MTKIITIAEMIVDLEEIAKKVCHEEGIEYNDFMTALANALNTGNDFLYKMEQA